MISKKHPAPSKIILTIFYLTLFLISNTAAFNNSTTITSENRVAYAGSPSVVKVSTSIIGNLLALDGTSRVTLFSNVRGILEGAELANQDSAILVDIPQFETGGTGTGFVVSSDGYIVINAHVIHKSDDEIREDFINKATIWATEEWPKILASKGYDLFPQTEYDVSLIRNFFNGYKVRAQQPIIYVYFGDPKGSAASPEGHPASIAKNDPVEMKYSSDMKYRYRSGKDVAVLKVEGVKDLLNAPLGDSDSVGVGDKAIVIGYPGIAESSRHKFLSSKSDLVPTVTSGIISARKKLPDDSDIFQTDADITHGNSGGPVFNENGEVIGIATFVSYTYLQGGVYTEVAGFNFLIPINVAKRFIRELNIDTSPSKSRQHLEKGLNYFWNSSYSQAEQEFNIIGGLNNVDKYAPAYAAIARNS